MRFVLDASVALAWFLDHPVPPYANRVKGLLEAGSRAVVPALWHLEMGNGFAGAERRGMLTAADADRCLVQVEQLLGRAIESESEVVTVREACATARTSGLTAYDAVYLEAARRSGLPLATLDQPLRAAAARAGVELLR
jgi:predicted nucleic acid-binding protein